jgi:hypothetical protein
VKSAPLKRVNFIYLKTNFLIKKKCLFFIKRLASGIIPYADDQSINVEYCGESQGCLIVPQHCNNDARCEYTLAWQVLDDETVKFHIVARAQGFVGVGFSNDEKRVSIEQCIDFSKRFFFSGR